MSQEELANRVGVSKTQVYLVEKGATKRPYRDVERRYAEVLGVSVDYLRYGRPFHEENPTLSRNIELVLIRRQQEELTEQVRQLRLGMERAEPPEGSLPEIASKLEELNRRLVSLEEFYDPPESQIAETSTPYEETDEPLDYGQGWNAASTDQAANEERQRAEEEERGETAAD